MEKKECKVGICDDRAEDARRIRDALLKGLQEAGEPVRLSCRCFTDGEELYAAAGREAFDLVFLDIEMPGLDGFGLAERLCRDHPSACLVFVSVHESCVFDSAEYSPLWFVRKGELEWDMHRALGKYLRATAHTRVHYRTEGGFGLRDVPVRDIIYVEGDGHSQTIRLADGGSLGRYGSLKAMEAELQGCHFLRIHKSYLVNQAYIREVGAREVYLTDGSVLEMGRDRKKAVREAMRRYGQERGSRRFS